jgi:hypothetical protein
MINLISDINFLQSDKKGKWMWMLHFVIPTLILQFDIQLIYATQKMDDFRIMKRQTNYKFVRKV